MLQPNAGLAETAVRDRLWRAGLQIFARCGYAATTVREIVAEAGVTKPALYYHFGSKEGLYLAILRESFAGFEALLTPPPAGSSREALLLFCRRFFASAAEHIDFVRLSHAIYFGPPQGAPAFDFDGFYLRMLQVIDTLVARGEDCGEFRRAPRQPVVWAIGAILQLGIQEQICQGSAYIDGAGMTAALEVLLDGISSGDER